MGLSNYQLVLLDNLIYLDTVVKRTGDKVEHIVKTLLYKDGIESSGAGTGTIEQDCMNHYNPEGANCMMTKEEWIMKLVHADIMGYIS